MGLCAGLAIAVAVAAWAVPWTRLPPLCVLALPVAADCVIALLREAQGGSVSGYSPLAVLPVIWVGLTQGRRAVVAISGCTALLFGLPIVVVGGEMYPSTGWRGVILWTVVSIVLGLAAHRVVTDQRAQARLARARARELDLLVEAQTAIATSRLELGALMTTAAERALALAGGDGAVVELVDGQELVYGAGAGAAGPFVGIRLRREGTLSGRCLDTRRVQISDDTENDPRVDGAACRRVGVRSMVVVPLLFDGSATGVLKVYAGAPGAFDQRQAKLLGVLGHMIGAGLAHARVLEHLAELAVTDELTGLPNRREWRRRLDHALTRARRSQLPLTVFVLDVDGLKSVNDRAGHSAGDELLRGMVRRWAATVRGSDVLGRLGGDEFGVLLEDTCGEAARLLAERLDAVLDDGQTASIGIAVWDGREDADALVARADAAMYDRKRGRRSSQLDARV